MNRQEASSGSNGQEQVALPERRLIWVGPDMQISDKYIHGVVFEKGDNPIILSVNRSHFPPFPLSVADQQALDLSIRSREAIIGAVHIARVGVGLYRQFHEMGGNGTSIDIPIIVTNLGEGPRKLQQGARIARPFLVRPNAIVTGNRLERLFANKSIAVSGKRGEDYKMVVSQKGEIVGFAVRIKDDARLWIPYTGMIEIDDTKPMEKYRQDIERFLEPVPQTRRRKHWLGKTCEVALDTSMYVVLSDKVYGKTQHEQLITTDALRHSFQTRSYLLDGGRTNWEVFVEIYGSTAPADIAEYAFFQVAQASRV